jgi:rhodanese-related sulfurtransferase
MAKISKIQQRLQANRSIVPITVIAEEPREVVAGLSTGEAPDGIKRVIFMSRDLASSYRFGENDVVVSITDTHDQPPKFFHEPKEVLHRGFHDHVTAYDEHHHKHRWARVEDGEAIVDFVLKHKDSPTIVVHCNMGQSRSKAAAISIAGHTRRRILYADRDGRVVVYRADDDSDEGNYRVRMAVDMAFMERDVEEVRE